MPLFLDARLMYDDDKLFRVINVSPHNRKVGSMKRLLVSDLIRKTFPALSVTVLCWTSSLSEAQTFLRGDADGSGVLDINDPLHNLTFQFLGSIETTCLDAFDDDDSGGVDISDPLFSLMFQFLGTQPIPDPGHENCGPDPTEDELACDEHPACDRASEEIDGFTFVGNNAQGYPEHTHDQTGIEFVLLPGGTFDMGSPDTEPNSHANERPVHEVTLDPFLIAKTEVTQAQYEAVMTGHATLDPTPSGFTGDDLPVEMVSWNFIQEFEVRTELGLPTEAQWEYAARGGTTTAFSFGDDCNTPACGPCTPADDFMWSCGNTGGIPAGTTHPVGEKLPNPFGLHDMHGNVWEWCEDVYDSGFYSNPDSTGPNPVATSGSGLRVIRGGSWVSTATDCRSAFRFRSSPDDRFNNGIGFRPAVPLP